MTLIHTQEKQALSVYINKSLLSKKKKKKFPDFAPQTLFCSFHPKFQSDQSILIVSSFSQIYKRMVRILPSSCKNYLRWLLEGIPHFHSGGRWKGLQLHIPGERSMKETLPSLTPSCGRRGYIAGREWAESTLLTWPAGTYTSPVRKVQRGISIGERSPGEQSMVTGKVPCGN